MISLTSAQLNVRVILFLSVVPPELNVERYAYTFFSERFYYLYYHAMFPNASKLCKGSTKFSKK
jgi:hypothetical protein